MLFDNYFLCKWQVRQVVNLETAEPQVRPEKSKTKNFGLKSVILKFKHSKITLILNNILKGQFLSFGQSH